MRSSNIPIMVVTQLGWMAFQIGVACAATFGAEQVIAWLGFEASYTDRPMFLRFLNLFVGIPALIWVMAGIMKFQVELEMAREERSEAGRVNTLFNEALDDEVTRDIGRDSRPRISERIRRLR
jgi:hypothetical protein